MQFSAKKLFTHKLKCSYNRNFFNYRIKCAILCLWNRSLWFAQSDFSLTKPVNWLFRAEFFRRNNKFPCERTIAFSTHYALNNDAKAPKKTHAFLWCSIVLSKSAVSMHSAILLIIMQNSHRFPHQKIQFIKKPLMQIDYFSIFWNNNKSCAAYQFHYWLEVCMLVKNTDFNK